MDAQNSAQENVKPEQPKTSAKALVAGICGGVPAVLLGAAGANAFVDLAIGGIIAAFAWEFCPELQAKTAKFLPHIKTVNADKIPLVNRVDWRGVFSGGDNTPPAINAPDLEALTRLILERIETLDTPNIVDSMSAEASEEEDPLFTVPDASDTSGVKRITVEQIVAHVEPNSYRIFFGRSLTKENNPAVPLNIYKQHFRFMGASQRGKSSGAAAFIDIVTRTHDKQHVLLALLDKEDQTSKLFAHLPHVARVADRASGTARKLHARTNEEVLECLMLIVMVMDARYELSKIDMLKQPILLVYLEEFLSLKNYFKSRAEKAKASRSKSEKEEKAISDYQTLVYCIEEIAQRGLKARVQLLLCAQVEYADDDFKEALVNVACGMSFCVRPTAAAAAGFRNKALIRQNAENNKVGQCVVETPDCNDLVLAPDFPLEERLIALEKAEAQPVNLSEYRRTSGTPPVYSEINAEQPINEPVYSDVNSGVEPIQEVGGETNTAFINTPVNEEQHAQNSDRAPVNDEIRKQIHRLKDKYPHRQLAEIVGLYGPKYHLYKKVCEEEGIAIEK